MLEYGKIYNFEEVGYALVNAERNKVNIFQKYSDGFEKNEECNIKDFNETTVEVKNANFAIALHDNTFSIKDKIKDIGGKWVSFSLTDATRIQYWELPYGIDVGEFLTDGIYTTVELRRYVNAF